MKKQSLFLLLAVALWCAGIFAAPVFAIIAGTENVLSRSVYFLYHSVCHQFESRSFLIAGYPLAVCERCSSIYLSFFAGILLMHFLSRAARTDVSPVWLLCCASAPMILDVVISWLTPYESTAVSRIITGGCFGFGLSLLLRQSLLETIAAITSPSFRKSYGIKSR